jgi:excinuclease ABC subunit A
MIKIKNAWANNLKNVSLEIPTNKLVAFAGPSGSGKSSLAIDILLHEGQRRICEALRNQSGSKKLAHALVDQIEGLPLTLGIEQDHGQKLGPYETVGSMTDLYSLVQQLYVLEGIQTCPSTGKELPCHTAAEVCEELQHLPPRARMIIFAPLPNDLRNYKEFLAELKRQGFGRLRIDGEQRMIEEAPKKAPEDWQLIVDRLLHAPDKKHRLFEAVQTSFTAGKGQMGIEIRSESGIEVRHFSQRPHSQALGRCLPAPSLDLLSYRSSIGACPNCAGKGKEKDTTCHLCGGFRLNPDALRVQVAGKSFGEILSTPLSNISGFAERLPSTALTASITRRLKRIDQLGVAHLTVGQPIDELSTGERSRIRIASLLSHELSSALYIFDEPSLGLSATEVTSVVAALRECVERGNSVLVVDHHPLLHKSADKLILFGPGAGENGGEIVSKSPSPAPRLKEKIRPPGKAITFSRLPGQSFETGRLNIVVGPSGIGKTRLLRTIHAQTEHGLPSPIEKAVLIENTGLQGNRRSCVATTAKLWKEIRTLLSRTRDARLLGYSAPHFSFNRSGGRCEACSGLGTLSVHLPPLPPKEKVCSTCEGRRFDESILSVRYRSCSVHDILEMEISAAKELFQSIPKLYRKLLALEEIGVGYLKLGQVSTTLSGGEGRRLRLGEELARALGRSETLEGLLVLLDEPASSVHPYDALTITNCLLQLRDRGATIIVATHQQELIERGDRILQLSCDSFPRASSSSRRSPD